MIVQTTIDEAGAVAVSIDSDGDQGDCWSTEILDDLLSRAASRAISVWLLTREGSGDDE